MPSAWRFFRRIACSALLLLSFHVASYAEQAYIHNIYLTCRQPALATRGKWIFDISTKERMEDMISELAALGVNAITYHSAYRSDGADYTPSDPRLKRAKRWSEDARPVENFLDICARHGIAGYLGVFFLEIDPEMARLASLDVVKTFRSRAGMAGFVPPIEASPMRGIKDEEFLDICREVKHIAPELLIMDYPNGPYSPTIVRLIVERGASGLVDIENVQFHGADERLKNFIVSRGMTHLVMGMCSRSLPIVHTHYKYGPDKAWLGKKHAYKVRQATVITATPYGTSIFSFAHAMWGEESGPAGGDSLWRRLVWYEAILSIQRMVPVYHAAELRSSVAILIPAHTSIGGQQLVECYWLPFAVSEEYRGCVPMFISYEEQLTDEVQVIICPQFERCDRRQWRMLEEAAERGRTIMVAGGIPPLPARDISPRARRIMGIEPTSPLRAEDFSRGFIEALGGITSEGALGWVEEPVASAFGKGRVVRIPADAKWAMENIVSETMKFLRPRLTSANLPEGYVLEHWRCSKSAGDAEFAVIFGTNDKQKCEDIELELVWKGSMPPVWLLNKNTVERLKAALSRGKLRVTVPEVGDDYTVVLFGKTVEPLLSPKPLLSRARCGGSVRLVCRVVNTTGSRANGVVNVFPPDGWEADENELRYELKAGESAELAVTVSVPADAQRRPYFVAFKAGKRVQRCMVFPEDGSPQVISEKEPPPAPKVATPRPLGVLGDEWKGVTAGERWDDRIATHTPGVCFYPRSREWDAPAEFRGKICRYGEVLPNLGGANFFVNQPDTNADLLVRITYLAKKAGKLFVYDGEKYHEVGDLPATDEWLTKVFRVPKELVSAPNADMKYNAGLNLLFDVRVNGIYVHRIEARRAPQR